MRRAFWLAGVVLLLAWIALTVTAGGARLAAGHSGQQRERVQRGAWPGWAHTGAALHVSAPAPVTPDAALQPPVPAGRLYAPPPATAAGLPSVLAPAVLATRCPPLTVARPGEVVLPVSPPPPRSA